MERLSAAVPAPHSAACHSLDCIHAHVSCTYVHSSPTHRSPITQSRSSKNRGISPVCPLGDSHPAIPRVDHLARVGRYNLRLKKLHDRRGMEAAHRATECVARPYLLAPCAQMWRLSHAHNLQLRLPWPQARCRWPGHSSSTQHMRREYLIPASVLDAWKLSRAIAVAECISRQSGCWQCGWHVQAAITALALCILPHARKALVLPRGLGIGGRRKPKAAGARCVA